MGSLFLCIKASKTDICEVSSLIHSNIRNGGSVIRGAMHNVSILKMYLVVLAEFDGKGGR